MDLPLRCPPPSDLVLPVPGDPAGITGPTRAQASGPRWRRVARGWYLPVDAPDVVEQRILAATAGVEGAQVTGWAALRMAGVGLLDGRDARARELPVPVRTARSGRRPREGVAWCRGLLPDEQVVDIAGVRCVRALPALLDAVRSVEEREAVVLVDAVLAARLLKPDEIEAWVWSQRPRGLMRLARAAYLASAGVRSPQETRLRLLCTLDAGRGPFLVNPHVVDPGGGFVAMPDLLDPRAGVAVEYDGSGHRTREQHRSDVARYAALRDTGLEVVTYVAPDLLDARRVVARLDAAYERAERQRLLGDDPGWRVR